MSKKVKMSRKARWVLAIVLAIIAFSIIAFIQQRKAHKQAWPTLLDVGECQGGTPEGLNLISYEEARSVIPSNTDVSAQVTQAYRYYLINGYSQQDVIVYTVPRKTALASSHEKLISLLEEKPGFDASEFGSVPFAETVNLLLEYQLLQNISAIGFLETHSVSNYQAEAINGWLKPLKYMHIAQRGSGVFGVGLSSDVARTFNAESCMGSEKHAFTYDQVKEFNAEVRKYLSSPDSLEQAIRDDQKSFLGGAMAIYDLMDDKKPNDVYKVQPVGWMAEIYIGWLGATREYTKQNIECVFSHLINNSRKPYFRDHIVSGLPKWCKGEEAGPYTVDPIGESILSAYLSQVRTIGAIKCHYEVELRVAMIAFALNSYKHKNGVYPDNLSLLIDEELILKDDLLDPFSIDRKGELMYRSENGGASWRIYSVGADQEDHGGVLPISKADPNKQYELSQSDLVYQSGERARRIKDSQQP